jgi:hypothetical protein
LNFLEKWYDTWWWAISERMDPLSPITSWEPDFFEYINEGWLDMYYEPPTDLEIKEDFIRSFAINSNPYYNEKYYDYEV